MNAEDIKRSMKERASICPSELDSETLREAGCLERVFVLPNDFNERVSYLGDMLVQICCRYPKDDRLRFTTGRICQTLSYLLNSSSWKDGTLYEFDLAEIRRKINPLTK